LGLALAGAGVGVRALAANGEALAVAKAAVAGEVHQPLDVHRGVAPQVALDLVVGIDGLADLQHLGVAKVLHAAALVDSELGGNRPGSRRPNSMAIGQRDDNALVSREVNPSNTSHKLLHAPQGLASHAAAPLSHRSSFDESTKPARSGFLARLPNCPATVE